MNRIDRLTGILLILQSRSRTAAELARHFEVSRRTVLRDIQALCELGVPVVAREGVGGGYSLPEDYRLEPLPLSRDEAVLLLLAFGTLEQLTDTPFGPARATLSAKLRALLPGQQLPAVESILAWVGVDMPERIERAPLLDPLIAAAQERRWVRIAYRSAERRSTQHILPGHVFAQNGYWYCRAYAAERADERTYRVDRIERLEPPGDDFQPPPERAPTPYDHQAHPRILATLTARGVAMVETERHLGRQIQHLPDGGGCLDLRCPPSELDWYARYFASLGEQVQVREPPELRQRIAALGRELVQRYGA